MPTLGGFDGASLVPNVIGSMQQGQDLYKQQYMLGQLQQQNQRDAQSRQMLGAYAQDPYDQQNQIAARQASVNSPELANNSLGAMGAVNSQQMIKYQNDAKMLLNVPTQQRAQAIDQIAQTYSDPAHKQGLLAIKNLDPQSQDMAIQRVAGMTPEQIVAMQKAPLEQDVLRSTIQKNNAYGANQARMSATPTVIDGKLWNQSMDESGQIQRTPVIDPTTNEQAVAGSKSAQAPKIENVAGVPYQVSTDASGKAVYTPVTNPATGKPFDTSNGSGQGRTQMMIGRTVGGADMASNDIQNLARQPLSSSVGLFTENHPTTILGATAKALTNELTPQDTQSFRVLSGGLARNLSGIEALGNLPPGSLTNQLNEVLQFQKGDTNLTKMQKLAQIKQIALGGLDTISSMQLTKAQKDKISQITNRFNKAVPYTNGDLQDLIDQQKTNPNLTLKDVLDAPAPNGAKESDIKAVMDDQGLSRYQAIQLMNQAKQAGHI